MIVFTDVGFAYDGIPIFDALSLSVNAGEVFGVLGPNGAGKSTLARLALGLLSPARGVITLDGAELGTLSRADLARRIAAMLQEDSEGFPMSVRDCVLLGRLPHLPAHGFENERDIAAAEAAMNEVGVRALADRALHTLSSGERRRVLFARTLAQSTKAMVLDEPAANLDLSHQLELFARLRGRARAGAAILVTVHDLNLALRYCDRIALLDRRGAARVGAPAELLAPELVREVFGVEVERGQSADGVAYLIATTALIR